MSRPTAYDAAPDERRKSLRVRRSRAVRRGEEFEEFDPFTDYEPDPAWDDENEFRAWLEESEAREAGMSIHPEEVAA